MSEKDEKEKQDQSIKSTPPQAPLSSEQEKDSFQQLFNQLQKAAESGSLVVKQEHIHIRQRSGPLPDPETLREYESICTGSAAEIISWAGQQTQHRIAIEKQVITHDVWRSWAGLAAGFILALVSVGFGGYLVYLGHDTAGATIATAAVVGLAGVFVYGSATRKDERVEKAKIMAKTASQE